MTLDLRIEGHTHVTAAVGVHPHSPRPIRRHFAALGRGGLPQIEGKHHVTLHPRPAAAARRDASPRLRRDGDSTG